MPSIDLNADLGEAVSAAGDEAMLTLVSSANVASGFHAGDPVTAWRTVAAASARSVVVGAHPSYRDREGFGRRALRLSPDELAADVLYQLGALQAIAAAAGTRVAYVKPHGALYNTIVRDEEQAQAVVAAVATFAAGSGLPVLGLPGSAFLRLAAEAGLRAVAEGFADRAYAEDGTLVPRSVPGAVLHDPSAVAAQAVRLARSGRVESLCVHGDTPGSVALASAVRGALTDAGLTIAPFVR